MKNAQANRIEWFLDFINIDLASPKLSDANELIQRMEKLFGKRLHPELVPINHTTPDLHTFKMKTVKRAATLERLQQNLKAFFIYRLLKRYEDLKLCNIDGWHSLSSSEITDLRTVAKLGLESYICVKIKVEPEVINTASSSNKIQWQEGVLEKSPLEVVSIAKNSDENFLISFLHTLDGVSLSSFKRCQDPGCEKWFFQKTQRTRKYCSDQCRSKINIREKRNLKKPGNFNRTLRIGKISSEKDIDLSKQRPQYKEKNPKRVIRFKKETAKEKGE